MTDLIKYIGDLTRTRIKYEQHAVKIQSIVGAAPATSTTPSDPDTITFD